MKTKLNFKSMVIVYVLISIINIGWIGLAEAKTSIKNMDKKSAGIIKVINEDMDQPLYQEISRLVQECTMTGDYVKGAFLSKCMQLWWIDFRTKATNRNDRNTRKAQAEYWERACNEQITFSQNRKLQKFIKKVEKKFLKSKTRIIYRK